MKKTRYKESKYNFIINSEKADEILMYNSRTNALAKMELEKYQKYKSFIEGNEESLDEELIKKLIYGGFIIESDIDELNIIREKMYAARYNNISFGLTIAPTLKCNFSCPYCYERGEKPGKMYKEVQEKIIKLLDLRKNFISLFSVTWYGGEPLLAFDVIEYLSTKFIEICKENNIKYGASIVTNGYLLSREIALKLKEKFNVNSVQITIDGPPRTHNKTRILNNGQPTFDKIINNIKECKDVFKKISLRVNVSKKNYLDVTELFEILEKEGLKENTSVYFAKVEPYDNFDKMNCFNNEEFDIIDMLYKRQNKTKRQPEYPSLKGSFCCADSLASFVITSDGYIYKCWEDVGILELAVGNLMDNDDTAILNQGKYIRNLHRYIMYDPTEDVMCKECKFLPICMGGCPVKRLNGRERCISFKYNFEQKILQYIEMLENYDKNKCTVVDKAISVAMKKECIN